MADPEFLPVPFCHIQFGGFEEVAEGDRQIVRARMRRRSGGCIFCSMARAEYGPLENSSGFR